jgi:hypothetical protein
MVAMAFMVVQPNPEKVQAAVVAVPPSILARKLPELAATVTPAQSM